MKTKVKVVSVLLALFLIAALCVGLAFALPNLNFNLKGSLSYTPQTKTYYELMPTKDTINSLVVSSNKFKIESSQNGGQGAKFCANIYGSVSGGRLEIENMHAGFQSYYSKNVFVDLVPCNSFNFGSSSVPYDPFEFSIAAGDYVIILGTGALCFNTEPAIFIREDAPKGQLLYFGNYYKANYGWDLKIPLQQENLTGQELIAAFDKGDSMLIIVEADGMAPVDVSSLSFEPFDQTSPGKKQVEVTFTNPFTNLQTTQTITVNVYDPNAKETTCSVDVEYTFIDRDNITASSIAQALTTSLGNFSKIEISHADGSSEQIKQVTQDMISNIKINEELNIVSFKLTCRGFEIPLQIYMTKTNKNHDDFGMFALLEGLRSNKFFAVEAGTTGFNQFKFLNSFFNDGGIPDSLYKAEFKFTYGGREMTLDEIYQTPGLKEIKVEVTLEDGRELVVFENFPVFVYDDENKIPTDADITAECWGDKNPSDMELLPDGSLDLSGCYLNVYYNCSRPSDQSLVLGQDYEQIPLTSDSVEVISFKLFDPGSSEPRTVITSIIYRVEVNGQEVAFVTGP